MANSAFQRFLDFLLGLSGSALGIFKGFLSSGTSGPRATCSGGIGNNLLNYDADMDDIIAPPVAPDDAPGSAAAGGAIAMGTAGAHLCITPPEWYAEAPSVLTPSSTDLSSVSSSPEVVQAHVNSPATGLELGSPMDEESGLRLGRLREEQLRADAPSNKLLLVPHTGNIRQVYVSNEAAQRIVPAFCSVQKRLPPHARLLDPLSGTIVAVPTHLTPAIKTYPPWLQEPEALPVVEGWPGDEGSREDDHYRLRFVKHTVLNLENPAASKVVLHGTPAQEDFDVDLNDLVAIKFWQLPFLQEQLCELHFLQMHWGPQDCIKMGHLYVAAWKLHVLEKVAMVLEEEEHKQAQPGVQYTGLLWSLPDDSLVEKLMSLEGPGDFWVQTAVKCWKLASAAWVKHLRSRAAGNVAAALEVMPFEAELANLVEAAPEFATVDEAAPPAAAATAGASTSSSPTDPAGQQQQQQPGSSGAARAESSPTPAAFSIMLGLPPGSTGRSSGKQGSAGRAARLGGEQDVEPRRLLTTFGEAADTAPDSSLPQQPAVQAEAAASSGIDAQEAACKAAGAQWERELVAGANMVDGLVSAKAIKAFPVPDIVARQYPGISVQEFCTRYTAVGYVWREGKTFFDLKNVGV